MAPKIVPEARHFLDILVRVPDKEWFRILVERMVVKENGLDIGVEPYASLMKGVAQTLGVGKLRPVPGEDVTLSVSRGVAGSVLKTLDRDLVLFGFLQESFDPLLGIFDVGIAHGSGAVAERPLGREVGGPCQPAESLSHLQEGGKEKEVEIEVSVGGTIGSERAVIVVDLLTEIEPGRGIVVVEKPDIAVFVMLDIERHVFVHRVGGASVVAHGVDVSHLKASPSTVDLSGALPQSVESTLLTKAVKMPDPVVPPPQSQSTRSSFAQHLAPLEEPL